MVVLSLFRANAASRLPSLQRVFQRSLNQAAGLRTNVFGNFVEGHDLTSPVRSGSGSSSPVLPMISRFVHCTLLRDAKRIAVSHRNISVQDFGCFTRRSYSALNRAKKPCISPSLDLAA